MMSTKRLIWKSTLCLALISVGMAVGFYLGASWPETANAAADVLGPEEVTVQHVCTPSNVAVFTNRIHIKCDTAKDSIRYFAVPTEDSKHAARVLSLFLTAKASGKRVGVDYNLNDTSGGAIGCATSDCRLARWVYIVN